MELEGKKKKTEKKKNIGRKHRGALIFKGWWGKKAKEKTKRFILLRLASITECHRLGG